MRNKGYERRREPRALTAAIVDLIDEHDDTTICVLEDLSPSGACIHSDIALRVGAPLTLRVASIVHDGVVKHCKPFGDGYHIGIHFAGGEWPAPIELPIHWIRVNQ
jgi:PilZ domain